MPEGYAAMKGLENISAAGKLEPELRELVKIRASQINGCAFCLDMHTKDARASGENEQRIYVLPAWRETNFYTSRERAALEWCEALTLVSGKGAPEELYGELEHLFSPEEIVELTITIVAINSWNRLAIGFGWDAGGYVSDKKRFN